LVGTPDRPGNPRLPCGAAAFLAFEFVFARLAETIESPFLVPVLIEATGIDVADKSAKFENFSGMPIRLAMIRHASTAVGHRETQDRHDDHQPPQSESDVR
jgi:hypothetical protein